MAYMDRDRSREKLLSSVAAALIVGGVGYGLVSGLAMRMLSDPEHHITMDQWAEPLPPPPVETPRVVKAAPSVEPMAVPRDPLIVPLPPTPTVIDLPPVTATDATLGGVGTGPATVSPPPPSVDHTSRATPRGDPASWVTQDDYPASALRAGSQGRTGFRIDIGADGRPTSCVVTASSGSAELDQAACRILSRRARFTPARDAAGNAVISSYTSSILWRLPAD